MIPKMLSTEGPKIAVADVNGDGLEDFFMGGAKVIQQNYLFKRLMAHLYKANNLLLHRIKTVKMLALFFLMWMMMG